MKLTPTDIQQQRFRSALLGFDRGEVDAFLDMLARDFEALLRENRALKEEIKRKDADIVQHRERERTLKQTMLTATRLTEDIKQNAQKEGEIVIAQAEAQADQIVQNAHARLVRIMEDMDELRRQRAQFEAAFRSMLSSHAKLIDAMTERDGTDEAEMRSLLTYRAGIREPPRPEERAPRVLRMRDVTVVDEELLTPRGGDR